MNGVATDFKNCGKDVIMDKAALRKKFSREWKIHYELDVLKNRDFQRRQCKKCGRYFWSVSERDLCGECEGYRFIKNPVGTRRRYVETWKAIENYFVKHGHGSVKPYPTVARWRDDLYFTIASISNFQPYVVRGEVAPPANPLIIPQPCIRFSDVANVGITGRHFTNFVMIGQHAFNLDKLFYWKEEAIEHDINMLTAVLGIPIEEIVFHEDVWAGGGNFGPSMEYFVRGLELGNCVFMQYEISNGTARELNTKVIDMGAGLSRFTWVTSGTATAYDVVFPATMEWLKRETATKMPAIFQDFMKLAYQLDIEVAGIEKKKDEISQILGIDDSIWKEIQRLQALYGIADHSLTLLFTIRDGMMPSNSGGGYNLRFIARRMFSFEEQFGFDLDYHTLLEKHMFDVKGLFDEYAEAIDVAAEIILLEREKYEISKEKAKRKLQRIVENKIVTIEDLVRLYESDGIPPEEVKAKLEEIGVKIEIPADFYERIRRERVKETKKMEIDVSKFPPTQPLYYERIFEFEAKVVGKIGNYIILDKTAFYPEGGGQVGDKGWLNDIPVTDTIKVGNVVLHHVSEPEKFETGMTVKGMVDWERRLRITRHHTATHLITAAARKILGAHVWQAGAKKTENKAHIDLTHYKRITKEELQAIERKVNRWVLENHTIKVKVMERTKAEQLYGFRIYQGGAVPGKHLRIVDIEGVDVEACGGTHHILNGTAEIGMIKIVARESVKDGVQRLYFVAGDKALDYVHHLESLLDTAAGKVSVPREDVPKAMEKFFTEWKEAKKTLNRIVEKIKQEFVSSDSKILELPISIKEFGILETEKEKIVLLDDGAVVTGPWKTALLEEAKKMGLRGGGKKAVIIKGSQEILRKLIDKFISSKV